MSPPSTDENRRLEDRLNEHLLEYAAFKATMNERFDGLNDRQKFLLRTVWAVVGFICLFFGRSLLTHLGLPP